MEVLGEMSMLLCLQSVPNSEYSHFECASARQCCRLPVPVSHNFRFMYTTFRNDLHVHGSEEKFGI